ncbi:AraC family transcriptional regulator [Arcticibacterium luteifluviistationis]|uniref:AraC family transcriptional regulator n=1 Tax=Arcticibacterium luteifluviistationis TaxID=1784714 RepID=A0A2Z4GAX3_9BACT|nr:AraC family transcriptional regulator [Arcticibacterium luteifluviistationis]AWV98294.1 AraC family transcriptional regulator [Arcticibacterium luteifluviistationis]
MRTPLEKNIDSPLSSITVLDLEEPHFDPNWHFHPHYQLFIVLEGEGTRLIGDSIQHFKKGDTVLLGPDLPHLWRNDKSYFEPNSELSTRGIVVYFTQEFLDNTLSNLPESIKLNKLLNDSYRGVEFTGKSKISVKEELLRLAKSDGYDAILTLLSLLNVLSKSTDTAFIASLGYTNTHKKSETERMHNVYEYAMKHFKESIKLEDVANLANMTIPAFCRYFKKRSNKTFSDFISEIRIGHACKMLEDEKYSVAEVCYESGFNTLSNFNKKFKEVTDKTPSQFKKELVGK